MPAISISTRPFQFFSTSRSIIPQLVTKLDTNYNRIDLTPQPLSTAPRTAHARPFLTGYIGMYILSPPNFPKVHLSHHHRNQPIAFQSPACLQTQHHRKVHRSASGRTAATDGANAPANSPSCPLVSRDTGHCESAGTPISRSGTRPRGPEDGSGCPYPACSRVAAGV